VAPHLNPAAGRVHAYVPRVLRERLAHDPGTESWSADGTAAYVDISGFTSLSERLAQQGREGAEQIADMIGERFNAILDVASRLGASLLKFGGDSMLLWFDGADHAVRACRAAGCMRQALDDAGPVHVAHGDVALAMSQGVHSGTFHFFAVGTEHKELLPTGPAWSHLVAMERVAAASEIVASLETAALLPPGCAGPRRGDGVLLAQVPEGTHDGKSNGPAITAHHEASAQFISPAVRAHLMAGGGAPEHRPVTIAFVRFEGVDRMVAQHGHAATASALNQLVSAVQASATAQQVTFLASDVDADGGKLILTAGAPRATVDDEERMLLALRRIVDTPLPMPVRIGVHRGAVFAGDIGTSGRRTYTVMGDAVNLTARLMSKAAHGKIYATSEVLRRSTTQFATTRLEPFPVKGKATLVHAWEVGPARSSHGRQASMPRLPITGRNAELGLVRKAFASARAGAGRLIVVSGEPGVGKTRLLEALRDAAAGFRKQHAACEAYTASTPYAVWRELLRELLAFGRDDPDEDIATRLRHEVTAKVPDLAPWLPLLGIAFGLDLPPTPEVEMLAEGNRRARLHEVVLALLQALVGERLLIEIENAHHMDEASAELLAWLAPRIGDRPWLLAVARREGASAGFDAPDVPTVVRVDLKALALQDTLRLAQLASQQNPLATHVLEVVARRSGGNPQFLRDLVRTAVDSGGIADLPDSAEAAAIAQIDGLAPDDRAVVRRAAVFGTTFHPRMLGWLSDEGGRFPAPTAHTWSRLQDFFEEESDGYLRFRRALLRDAAYQGLPYRVRRRLHGEIARHMEAESQAPEEIAGALSLHYFEADDAPPAWRYSITAALRAQAAFGYVEAAALYTRALEAARRLPDLASGELARVHEAVGDAWFRVGEYRKAADAFTAARPLAAADPLFEAQLMIKLSRVEEKLGNLTAVLRWIEQARGLWERLEGAEVLRWAARASAWQATVLQSAGRTDEALACAERAAAEAEAADDAEALGEAHFVLGWAHGELGMEDAEPLMQRSLEAYRRAGNMVRQASLLSDLGVLCQWTCRWDEALAYYERARVAATRIGSSGTAAIARFNAAEIRTDRGEWSEAEAQLLEVLRFFKATEYHYMVGACLALIARVALHTGRIDQALTHLDEAKAQYRLAGAEAEIPSLDVWIAECRLVKGDVEAALDLVGTLMNQASDTAAARLIPQLQRIEAHARMRQGDLWGARDALEASLAGARERNNRFEATLAMLSLIELDRQEGTEPAHEMLAETRRVLAELKVRAVPAIPKPAP
jgi:class 3 adenylate cyclase/tetratricopeptide (TPR) repeat protein